MQDRRRVATADHERDADEGDRHRDCRHAGGADAVTQPQHDGRDERAERDHQRSALRFGVVEPREREQIEAREAERAEAEEA